MIALIALDLIRFYLKRMKRANTYFWDKVLILCVIVIISAGCSEKEKNFITKEWQFIEGDIVFRRGYGAKSNAAMRADKEGLYSHVGIIVKPESEFMVIHITPGEREKGEKEDKIKMETPELFFHSDRAQNGAVIRLKDSLEYAAQAAKEACIIYKKGILFDHNYSLEDSTKMYCTELIWKAYLYGGMDITQGRRKVMENFMLFSGTYIFPSHIFVNDEFSLIYKF